MSVAGYFGQARELRLKGWSAPAARVDGPVLEGSLSVEGALSAASRPRCPLDGDGDGDVEIGRSQTCPTAAYASVAHYDPVLRSHCRLDKAG
jgi:hypothetical protein